MHTYYTLCVYIQGYNNIICTHIIYYVYFYVHVYTHIGARTPGVVLPLLRQDGAQGGLPC